MDNQQDRFQRQARRQSTWREETSGASPFQHANPFTAQPAVKRLKRSDTGISPLEVHPGNRVPSIQYVSSRKSSFVAPGINGEIWPREMFRPSLEMVEERSSTADLSTRQPTLNAAVKRSDTPIDLEKAAAKGRTSNSHVGRFTNILLGRSPIRPRGKSGLQVASAVATAHANAFLNLQVQQGLVYISEYQSKTDKTPFRTSPPFNRVSSISGFLDESPQVPALRVIYIYNHEDAMNFLTEAFCVDHPHFEKSDRSFRDWISSRRANRGAFDKAVAWRPCWDAARNVSCIAFGIEMGHDFAGHVSRERASARSAIKTAYAKASNYQRVSVYLQRHLKELPHSSRMDVFNSGTKGWRKWAKENTVLIYEKASGRHTQIINGHQLQALELRHSSSADERSAIPTSINATENVLTNVFHNILRAWRRQITEVSVQHELLEDAVYERPSDDSHAGGLWGMSQHALEMAKLVNRHATLCQDIQEYFNNLAERSEGKTWLEEILKDFRQTSMTIKEDFIGPTDYMIDLMYKSISIRDSRQSLELNASLWRLSWITFIFLPLTFLVGLFGMNVSTFQHYPSIKWYWVAAAPLMILVVGLWFLLKNFMPQATKLLRYTEAELEVLRDRPG